MKKWIRAETIPEAYDITGRKTWALKMMCPNCGFEEYAIEGHFLPYNYCPHCGEDMGDPEMIIE